MDSGSIFPGYFSSYAMHDPVLTLSQVLKQPLELRGLQWRGVNPKQLHKRRKKLINNFLCLLFVWDWYMNFNVVTRLFVYQSRIKNYRGGVFNVLFEKRENMSSSHVQEMHIWDPTKVWHASEQRKQFSCQCWHFDQIQKILFSVISKFCCFLVFVGSIAALYVQLIWVAKLGHVYLCRRLKVVPCNLQPLQLVQFLC